MRVAEPSRIISSHESPVRTALLRPLSFRHRRSFAALTRTEQSSAALSSLLCESPSLRLFLVYATTEPERGPLILVVCSPAGAATGTVTPNPTPPDSLPSSPYWTRGMQGACFVQISPRQRLARGSFARARADVGTGNALSIHLGQPRFC